jgi:anaerobic magnesium-protoporphyrin IX monomethyl ester cyclase
MTGNDATGFRSAVGRKPRILLLHPYNPLEGYHYAVPQVALGYLSAALKRHGFDDVHVKDAQLYRWDLPQVSEYLQRLRPDVVGIRVWSHQLPVAQGYIDEIRRLSPSTVIVVGGPHVSTVPGALDRLRGVDYGVAGEAEDGLPLLLRHLSGEAVDLDQAPGLIRFAPDGTVRKNGLSLKNDLNEYAVDWDILELDQYHRLNERTTAYDHGDKKNAFIFVTRGCPYPCTYCAAGITNGKQIRSVSAGRALDDVEYLYDKYGVRHFNIMDDNFTFYKEVVMEFCEEFEKRRSRLPDVTFHNPNGVRVDRLDDEMLAAMAACGWKWLHIGIESASEATLQRMRKRLKLDVCRENIAKIRRHGMKCWGFFILGFKDETLKDMRETIDFAVGSELTAATFSLFSPIPGTAVYDELLREGRIEDDYIMTGYMSTKTRVYASGVDADDLHRLQRQALMRFYARPDRAFHLLRDMNFKVFANRFDTIFLEPARRRLRALLPFAPAASASRNAAGDH